MKRFLFFAFAIGLLAGATASQAQTVNMSRYINLTVTKDSAIKLNFVAATPNTLVKVKSGSLDTTFTVNNGWTNATTYTAADTTMTIYGDITSFDCSENGANITALDAANNTTLSVIRCYDNSLRTLNVSNNTTLETLWCWNNRLTSLNVSSNTALTELSCSSNQLSNLDVSNNALLSTLACDSNQLSSLNVSNNTALKLLYCYGNKFNSFAINDIYCQLPVRIPTDDAKIFLLHESSTTKEQDTVKATNASNATAKNWKVQTYKNDDNHTDITTTGSYVCGGGTTTYDLKIAGVDVTSANCSDLSEISGVSGIVNYDPANKVLTLQNTTIQINTNHAIVSDIDGLTIKVIGTNTLIAGGYVVALRLTKPLTITGGGVLNANSVGDCGIFAKETNLTIDGCTVNTRGRWGIAGKDGSSEMLTIKNSIVTAEGTEGGSIADFASLTLDGCAITEPAGAAFDATKKAVTLGGEIVKSRVLIAPEPNMERYITLTVKKDSVTKLDFRAAAAITTVRIVSGSADTTVAVDTNWVGIIKYTAADTTMTIYGDIISFSCRDNETKITSIDVSHNRELEGLYCSDNKLTTLDVSKNTKLKELLCYNNQLTTLDVSKNTKLEKLYCYGNKFTTAAVDNIYCTLPVRKASDDAIIYPLDWSSSADEENMVTATNAHNATSKNWTVLKYIDGQYNDIYINTTGTYVCSATDISDATAEPTLTLYPNPVADVLYLSATARTIRVYNIYGTEVAHATDTERVEVSHLSAGVYTVKADGTVAKMVKR